jgi:hypothetical protein
MCPREFMYRSPAVKKKVLGEHPWLQTPCVCVCKPSSLQAPYVYVALATLVSLISHEYLSSFIPSKSCNMIPRPD